MYFVNYQKGRILIKTTIHSATLSVSIDPFEMSETNDKMDSHKMSNYHALLGITKIKDTSFFIVASEVNLTSTIQGSSIYQIKRVELLPICQWQQRQILCGQLKSEISALVGLFDIGFHYYSDYYNLSFPYALNKIRQPTFEQRTYYQQFIWNKVIMESKSPVILSKWCRPMIEGYVENFSILLPNDTKIMYYLISRRSSLKAGTRFYSRGIDDNGNVANFTETQQIICLKTFVMTHLQIRGSVPIFFEEVGVNGIMEELNILRSLALTQKPYTMHFQKLKPIYKRVLCLNLLSVKKAKQQKLIDFFEKMVSQTNLKYMRYQYFDFHEQCKGDKFQNSSILIDKVNSVLQSFSFNCFDTRKNTIMGEQSGVVRTNCLDCLDRTNYVQSRVAVTMLKKILQSMSLPEQRDMYDQQNIFEMDPNKTDEITLINSFNMIWADNGDSISLHYTGCGSTHTDVTKGGGKRGLFGNVTHKFKSLMRFYTQFTDIKKHEAINNLVMTKKSSFRRSMTLFQQCHDSLIFSYSITPEVPQVLQMAELIIPANPSFVIFQLFSEVPAEWHNPLTSLWTKKPKFQLEWREFVAKALEALGYVAVSIQEVDRNCLMIFTLKNLAKEISNLKTEKSGPTMKSSDSFLITKFSFLNSSFVFTGSNCFKLEGFYLMLDEAHQNAFQSYKLGQYRSSSILEQNYRIIVGSIGSHTSLDSIEAGQIEKAIEETDDQQNIKQKYKVLAAALDHDQFAKTSQSNQSLFAKNYSEGPITFFPGKNRILFWNTETLIVKVVNYGKKGNCIFAHYSYEIKKKM